MSSVWAGLMIIGIVSAILEGKPERLLVCITQGGSDSIQYVLSLFGIMAFWSGIYGILDKTGLLGFLTAKFARPIFKRVFRRPLSPAQEEAIFASIAANLLGLGNAATVWGLRAMAELKKGGQLTPNMATFLVLLSTGFTVFPSTVISMRAAVGSQKAALIWVPTLVVSVFGAALALLLDRLWGEG
ncbi:MAG: hypothetical protein ACOX29_05450 [Bacillota bacterium]|jgi:spore maturation protein A|nr:hypothetical protein [Bacillota bacterium]NLU54529.1 hypothetical protein [Bacillota bacterium]HOA91086.1 hypothetical protein [Bacillota bacterium]HOJ46506.1 hypothetical protein [Bacillota bacterium]HOP54702.1 hypothetical protein [Bacillota bacterium]